LLPMITKETDLRKFDIDFSSIREDPIFGEFRNMPARLTPINFKTNTLKDVLISKRQNTVME
jgi:hypothetical protein